MTESDARREEARRYVRQLRAFQVHATVFAVVVPLLFVINAVINLAAGIAGDVWAWWIIWVVFGWGIGIAVHGLVVRAARAGVLGSDWEERKIDEVLARQSKG